MTTKKKRTTTNLSTKKSSRQTAKAKNKIRKVMHEYKEGSLHSRSKRGPVVTSRKQAVAIALREAGVSRKKTSQTSKQ